MHAEVSKELMDLETRWREREREWAYKLGRLRLGVEPIEEQLTRYRRTTWVLTLIPALLALFILTLFTVFGRPDIGGGVILILFGPMIVLAWLDYGRLKGRAAAYLADRARYKEEKERLMGSLSQVASRS